MLLHLSKEKITVKSQLNTKFDQSFHKFPQDCTLQQLNNFGKYKR